MTGRGAATSARYARVFGACVRNCLARELEFRSNFLFSAVSTAVWAVLSIVLAGLVFTNVREIRGWDMDRMFILTGSFLIVESLMSTLFQRNMQKLSELVNKGELDFVLTRPISSQFLVSIRYLDFGDLPTAVVGLVYVGLGVQRLGLQPGPVEVALYALLLLCALTSFYALWFMTVTLVLYTGRIENISAVMDPVLRLGRMPTDVFRGVTRPLLVYVIPIAAISTLPSQALLGTLDPAVAPYQVVLALVLLWASHRFWHFSLRRYTSASS
jgi:ABC-2 type transport system permease protein